MILSIFVIVNKLFKSTNELIFIHETQSIMTDTDFLIGYSSIYRAEKEKLPYHFNLLDEIRVNENAHSRILYKLFLYQDPKTKKYEFFERFISFISNKYAQTDFKKIKVSNPVITTEQQRIDLWVRENGKYAIIIENKINYAIDQELQLERYIDTTISSGFNEEEIFVVYLAPSDDKEPEEKSWGRYIQKEIKNNRYLNLSFKDDILDWLTTIVLPEIKLDNQNLKSGIQQYIDHLKGRFNLREEHKKMNMELQKYLNDSLELDIKNQEESLEKIKAKKELATNLINELNLLEDNVINIYFKSLDSKIQNNYSNYKIVGNWKEKTNYINIGVLFEEEPVPFSVLIEYNVNFGIYYGVSSHYTDNIVSKKLNFNTIVENLSLSTKNGYDIWYAWQHTSFMNAFTHFETIISEILKNKNSFTN